MEEASRSSYRVWSASNPLDIVAFEYIKQKSCERAMAILAKYIVFMTLLGTVDRLEECEQ